MLILSYVSLPPGIIKHVVNLASSEDKIVQLEAVKALEQLTRRNAHNWKEVRKGMLGA